jgi:hypothetical protein
MKIINIFKFIIISISSIVLSCILWSVLLLLIPFISVFSLFFIIFVVFSIIKELFFENV